MGTRSRRIPRLKASQRLLLDEGARVNVVAKSTMWTPLNWLCLYGDSEFVKEFIDKKNAKTCLPDHRGLFPIDYAGGINYKEDIVEFLIQDFLNYLEKEQKDEEEKKRERENDEENHLFKNKDKVRDQINLVIKHRLHKATEKLENRNEENMQKKFSQLSICERVQMNTLASKRPFQLLKYHEAFYLSPTYATSILFWACRCAPIKEPKVKKLIKLSEAYPEG